MRRRPPHHLKSSQQTIRSWGVRKSDPTTAELERAYRTLYPHMLIEDISLDVMPIGGRSERPGFRVFLQPSDQQTEERVTDGLKGNYARGLAGAVSGFLRQTAMKCLAFGETLYEIVYLSEEEKGVPVEFRLESVLPGAVRKKGPKYIQVIPEGEAHKRGLAGTIQIDPEYLLAFELSPTIRHRKEMILILKDMSEEPAPKFLLRPPESSQPAVPYDFSKHHRTTNIVIAKLTQAVGWRARRLFDKDMLEYYSIHRFLRFEQFKLRFREHLLATLNEGLERVGRRMNFSTQIEVEGLCTQKDIDGAFSKLESGPSSFKELIDPFLD